MTCVNDVQPLALVHDNELVYIEKNDQKLQKEFSCFRVFKLKGPIGIDYLLDIIFPPLEKHHYDLEISKYNGQYAKIKFSFTNRTHTDLIRHLQNAAAKFYDISENGLVDWIASDTITFRTIYQNVDMMAIQQLRDTNASDSRDPINNAITSFSSSSISTPPNMQLYPIIDEEAIERELEELSERISSQKDHDLERVFYNTFRRRDMTITIQNLTDEFFCQIDNLVAFVGNDYSTSSIDEMIIHNFARYLFQQAEQYIDVKSIVLGDLGEFVNININSCKFGMIVTLWNLINVFHSINVSYKVLLKTDKQFKQILQSQKTNFMSLLSNIDKILTDLLKILNDEIDREKYERLQQRLANFVEATESLMNLVMIINNKCNEQIEMLENQKKELTNKLLVSGITIGISALIVGGFIYNNNKKKESSAADGISKPGWIGGAIECAMGLTAGTIGYSTRTRLQNAIEKQTNILDQLKSIYTKLSNWKNLSDTCIERDINEMNNDRTILIDDFSKIKRQCKCLCKIFEEES